MCRDTQRWNCESENNRIPKTVKKGIQKQAWVGKEGDPLGIIQKAEVLPYYEMAFVKRKYDSLIHSPVKGQREVWCAGAANYSSKHELAE